MSADPVATHPSPRFSASLFTRRRVSLVLLVLAVAGGCVWRYRITRPEYRLAGGQDAIRAKDWDTAGRYADRLEAAGYTDQSHLLRGEILLERQRPELALPELNRVRADGPYHLPAAALAGRCLLALGDLKEARRVLLAVVAEQPDHTDAHRGLAAVAYDLGHLGDAVDHLERVAELDPTDARPHRLIGLIYKDLAQDERAVAAYREAMRREPPSEVANEIRTELAEVLTRQGKFEEGFYMVGPAMSESAQVTRAECLRGLGRPDEAAAVLEAALLRQPTFVLHRLRGQVFQDQGRPKDALRSFERAVEMGPTDHQSHYLLSQAYAAAGRKSDAAREQARVEEIRGDLDRITALTREAMANPWDPAVRTRLAEVCDRMGKPELAAVWRKAAAACVAAPR